MRSAVLHVRLEPEMAREVEALAEKLELSKSRLVDILIRCELRYERGNREAFHIIRRVIGVDGE
ncbi:hypothetical protein DRP77_09955 [Candidatus Poribacteria bacterium]|nr:MAG: hypothetical protein DRP77_09955 [Candidatus Poribacteria bacterium]